MVLLSPGREPVGSGLTHPGVEDGLVGVHRQGHAHAGQLAGQGQAVLPGGDLAGGVTTRVTPTAAARSTSSAAVSGASDPGPPVSADTGRCVWLSVTGAASGATASAGGQDRSRFLGLMRAQAPVTSSGTEPV